MTRKDILELRIKNGAKMGNAKIDGLRQGDEYSEIEFDLGYASGGSIYRMNVYQIIYSPRSNFFSVMYGDEIMTLGGIGPQHIERSDYHKCRCVMSKDPLKYIRQN